MALGVFPDGGKVGCVHDIENLQHQDIAFDEFVRARRGFLEVELPAGSGAGQWRKCVTGSGVSRDRHTFCSLPPTFSSQALTPKAHIESGPPIQNRWATSAFGC